MIQGLRASSADAGQQHQEILRIPIGKSEGIPGYKDGLRAIRCNEDQNFGSRQRPSKADRDRAKTDPGLAKMRCELGRACTWTMADTDVVAGWVGP